MENEIESLRRVYCPPLDDALFYALANDFDLTVADQRNELESILSGLKEQAVIEQELELVPDNRAQAAGQGHGSKQHSNTTPSLNGNTQSATTEDGVASVTTGMSELKPYWPQGVNDSGLSSASSWDLGEEAEDLVHATTERKEAWLKQMFKTVPSDRISIVLNNSKGDLQSSIEELLNLSFIHANLQDDLPEDVPISKGIDGFMIGEDGNKIRKSKAKNRRLRNRADYDEARNSASTHTSGTSTPVKDRWKAASEDVEFITSRTQIPQSVVMSIYHENQAQLAATIRAFARKEHGAYHVPKEAEDAMQLQMEELKFSFLQVPDRQIYGVLLMAGGIPSAAKELLEAMITPSYADEVIKTGKLTGFAQYTPLSIQDDDGEHYHRTSQTSTWSAVEHSDPFVLATRVNTSRGAATQAFSQAGGAHKLSKSNHLYGGAAAYYASVGRERAEAARSQQALLADATVAHQSSSTHVDLHGVTVADALRISRARVQSWWDAQGDQVYARGGRSGGEGFRIVTGVGTHSVHGIGKIGPAVSKMLMSEGWRVNIQRGEIIVEGRVIKK